MTFFLKAITIHTVFQAKKKQKTTDKKTQKQQQQKSNQLTNQNQQKTFKPRLLFPSTPISNF